LVHATRLKAVIDAVAAVTLAGRLGVGPMGRHFVGATTAKHSIKRFDRLLSNEHLVEELPDLYRALAHRIIEPNQRVVVLLDWTHVYGVFHALVAAVSFRGRAMVVLSEVFPEKRLGSPAAQKRFLRRLKTVLPDGSEAIVVTDAGFHGDVFREARNLGWHFIGRIRGTGTMRQGNDFLTKDELYRRATRVAKDVGTCHLYKHRPIPVRVVLIRKPRRNRRSKPSRNKETLAYRKSCRDPWLLVTSLERPVSAQAIVDLYARRMQIEETFRDAKSHRFGWSFGALRSRSKARLAVLLALASIAMLAVILVGFSTEQNGTHRQLQANTSKRRVLSLFTVGKTMLARGVERFRLSELLKLLRSVLSLGGVHESLKICGDP
jgi:hypothetical protein